MANARKLRWVAAVSVFLSFVRLHRRRSRLSDSSSIAGHEVSGAATAVSLVVSFLYSYGGVWFGLRVYGISGNDSFCQLFSMCFPA